jgi:hypothetical protein
MAIYLSGNGNDTTGNGTQGAPWKTLTKAAPAGQLPADTIYWQRGTSIDPGSYRGQWTLPSGARCTIRAYGIDPAQYGFGEDVTVNYTHHPGGAGTGAVVSEGGGSILVTAGSDPLSNANDLVLWCKTRAPSGNYTFTFDYTWLDGVTTTGSSGVYTQFIFDYTGAGVAANPNDWTDAVYGGDEPNADSMLSDNGIGIRASFNTQNSTTTGSDKARLRAYDGDTSLTTIGAEQGFVIAVNKTYAMTVSVNGTTCTIKAVHPDTAAVQTATWTSALVKCGSYFGFRFGSGRQARLANMTLTSTTAPGFGALPTFTSASSAGTFGGGNAASSLALYDVRVVVATTKAGFVLDAGQDLIMYGCRIEGATISLRISGGATHIERSEIIGFTRSGVYAEPTVAQYIESGGYIGHNYINGTESAKGDGIALHGNGRNIPSYTAATGWIVEYNTVLMKGAENCIDVQEQYVATVRFNYGENSGQWVYQEGEGSLGNLVYGNTFANCAAGFNLRGNTYCFGNRLLNWSGAAQLAGGDAFAPKDNNNDVLIANNYAEDAGTYNGRVGPQNGVVRGFVAFNSASTLTRGVRIHNNIFVRKANPNGAMIAFYRNSEGISQFDNSIEACSHNYYVDLLNDSTKFAYGPATWRSLTAWRSAHGWDADPYSVRVAGLSTLKLNNKQIPAADSPLVGAGRRVTDVTSDHVGAVFLNPPTIGPYEVGTVGPQTEAIPTLSSISPDTKQEDTGAFVITARGNNYTNNCQIQWRVPDGPWTTLVRVSIIPAATDGVITATVPAGNIVDPGTANVRILNTLTGDGSPTSKTFTISAGPVTAAAPVLTRISPITKEAGAAQFTLSFEGLNFNSNCKLLWDGAQKTTTITSTVPSASTGTAVIPDTDVVVDLTFPLQVYDTVEDKSSNNFYFTVTPAERPAPTLSSIEPTGCVAGADGFGLFLRSADSTFNADCAVYWDGVSLAVTTYDAGLLSVVIPAEYVDATGRHTVIVTDTGTALPSLSKTFSVRMAGNPYPDDVEGAVTEPAAGGTTYRTGRRMLFV